MTILMERKFSGLSPELSPEKNQAINFGAALGDAITATDFNKLMSDYGLPFFARETRKSSTSIGYTIEDSKGRRISPKQEGDRSWINFDRAKEDVMGEVKASFENSQTSE